VTLRDGQLHGRGAVDAKGPLAAFAAAAAGLGPQTGLRIVVVGAVEEEAASSRGARRIAADRRPDMCIIGEPTGGERVALGYKGRLLADLSVRQPLSHRAGPDATACELAVDYWSRVQAEVAKANHGRERAWDQLQANIRSFASEDDGLFEAAHLALGFRLPTGLEPDDLKERLLRLRNGHDPLSGIYDLRFRGEESAFRAEKNTPLVRAFLAAIREEGGSPGFVVKTGTSDMNVVGPIWRCPIVAYGPGDSALDHTPEEHVVIEEWLKGVRVLERALSGLAQTGST
jgi:LysW-gamma-L-lysine carboxypeptidase